MPVIACNLQAIGADQRSRYTELVKRLRSAIRSANELSDGYGLELDSDVISLPELAEWITMERLCCPFLLFQFSVSGNRPEWRLVLTGPTGVKAILASVFCCDALN
jgi:hypothetical protein